ncbi:hypothetical protein HHE92_07940 [Pseudoalteromonas arctica]|uniref:hypothetical protein n=1 Tax=Pseudoalteromonas TaxID=53246 RepID=UPI0013FDD0E1|nr:MULTISPECIES: hypothetical protein [Pseudoalteromonas]MBB1306803.1 hypothetical protein [Pseudoalteromonas sp. SR43-5]NMP79729.1 hypothetical protein [Pseudoalteromonas arctica]|tara:strand:- start:766 stop:1320 length:555 start_codon:yes stop_codon:yes gene_type:complete
MKKPDFITVIAIVLCVSAGAIIGQSFSFEVKLSDLIALTATLITFTFAYFGFKSNNAQYINSITPIVTKFELGHNNNYTYTIFVNNHGTGPALNVDLNVLVDGEKYTLADFLNLLVNRFGDMENRYSHPAVLAASREYEVLSLKAKDNLQYDKIHNILKKSELTVQFDSIQQREFKEMFLLGFE